MIENISYDNVRVFSINGNNNNNNNIERLLLRRYGLHPQYMACSDKARDTVLYGPDVDCETQTGPREPLMRFPERNEYGEKGNQEVRYLHIAPFLVSPSGSKCLL